MEKDTYRHTNTAVSLLNYHFVFCPRYRRKIFDVPNVEDYFKLLVESACAKHGIQILALECNHDHVHKNLLIGRNPAPLWGGFTIGLGFNMALMA